VRLKAGAAFAESGPIHDLVVELWKGSYTNKQELIDKVGFSFDLYHRLALIGTGNWPFDQTNK
jgi:hypothetical protein